MEHKLLVFVLWVTVYAVPFALYKAAKFFGEVFKDTDNFLACLFSLILLLSILPVTYALIYYLGPIIFR